MKKNDTTSQNSSELRRRAEDTLGEKTRLTPNQIKAMSPLEIEKMLHELRVHQIELEIQNEELRRTQVELDISRANYFDLYDLAPVGYCVLSTKGLILVSNLTASTLLGLPKASLSNRPLSQFIYKEDQGNFYLHKKRLFETGEPQTLELRMLNQNGETFWVSQTLTLNKGEDDTPVCRVVLNDITKRKIAEGKSQESQALLSTVIGSAMDGIVTADEHQNILIFNVAAEAIFGRAASEVIGQPLTILLPERFRDGHNDLVRSYKSTAEGTRLMGSDRIVTGIRANGDEFPIEASISRGETAGGHHFYTVILRDITKRLKIEEARRISEERYELVAKSASDTFWEWELESEGIFFSPRFAEMLGCLPEDAPKKRTEFWKRFYPDDLKAVLDSAEACARGDADEFDHEFRLRCKGDSYRWFHARGMVVKNSAGIPVRFVGSMTDINTRKTTAEQMKFTAFHDALTGLPNRTLFFEHVGGAINRARREKSLMFAVLILDIDHFKNINDSLGHMVGDQLLIEVGRRINKCLRQVDTASRLGGDEFGLLLEKLEDVSDTMHLTSRLLAEIAKPFSVDSHEISVTSSIGIAFNSPEYNEPVELLRNADIAMYRAKTAGRGRYEIFDPVMHQQAQEQLEMEQDLLHAQERGELTLHFQPIVSLQSGTISGYEALLRWNHFKYGMVPPSVFIPMAENMGMLIVSIGEMVLREACEALKRMEEKSPGLCMNVNVSTRQIYQSDCAEVLREIVESCGVSPKRIRLEVTESILMDRPEIAREVLTKLTEFGFTIHIDDFGTGYSSLKYLLDFPIQTIKIDRSFVNNIPNDQRAMVLVKVIFALAEKLKLGVIAEGVETEEQLATLRQIGCRHVQGYLFSRPLPESDATALLTEGKHW